MRVVEPEQLGQAAEALEGGELVIVPTRRWYMICGDASDNESQLVGPGVVHERAIAALGVFYSWWRVGVDADQQRER